MTHRFFPAIILSGFALTACGAPEMKQPTPAENIQQLPAPTRPSGAVTVDDPEAADAWQLTKFEPATNEVYCVLRKISEETPSGDLMFITEIAGVPAQGAVGINGQNVTLDEVSKTSEEDREIWTYESVGGELMVELQLTEVADGFESRSYEGTIQVLEPEKAAPVPIAGDCGV